MHLSVAVIVMLAAVSLSSSQNPDEIIRNDFDGPHEDGSYRWAIQTGGGIFHEQKGSLETGRSGDPSLYVRGQYQYIDPDGQVINVLYTAGENGFEAQGAHLPTPPPIPVEIQRALDYIASLTPKNQ